MSTMRARKFIHRGSNITMAGRNGPGMHGSGYLDRLSRLIQERLVPGADKARIDARIWELFGAEWAVMFTDLVGFSRCAAEFGIIHFLQTIAESRRLFEPCIDARDGILIKTMGDSMLILFRKPDAAVKCAIDMQRSTLDYNQDKVEAEKVLVCVGIGFGKVLSIEGQDVFGAEVNAAAKLGEDTARAGEILVTHAVAESLPDSQDLGLEQLDRVPEGIAAAYRVSYATGGVL